jgi:Domain of unknown function (DUF4260)
MEATVRQDKDETGRLAVSSILRPAAMLRVEGATLLATSVLLYWLNGGSWVMFALLLFVPDLSMLGYLAGTRVGAATYNVFHAYPLPGGVAMLGLIGGSPLAVAVALIWLAHIGLDRMLGYGLKYPTEFKDTHLGRV